MRHSRTLSRPTLSGQSMVQPSPRVAGTPQAGFVWPSACVADAASTKTAAKRRRRYGLLPSRMLPSPFPLLRRRWDRDLYRRSLQHSLMEGVELRIGLAPAAIGKAEIGIAEHAYEPDLYDIERPRQHLRLVLESRHADPRPLPVVIGPCLPPQRLGPHHALVAAQQHGIEHALQQGMIALHLPSVGTGGRDQLAAAGIEIFDDNVGIGNEVA